MFDRSSIVRSGSSETAEGGPANRDPTDQRGFHKGEASMTAGLAYYALRISHKFRMTRAALTTTSSPTNHCLIRKVTATETKKAK